MDLKELAASGPQRHPWELARADFFCELLARRALDHRIARVLDVGAGDAFFATRLATLVASSTEITCVDPNYEPALIAELAPGLPANVRLSRELPAVRADLILLLDVLEHIEDDRGYLRALAADSLNAEGLVLISVPAWPSLFSLHDRMLSHHRRYTPSAAHTLIEDCGLRVLHSGGSFHSLLPLRVAQLVWSASRESERVWPAAARGASTELTRWRGGERLTRWVLRGLKLDNMLSGWAAARDVALPGLSWWALCEKRPS